MIKQSKLTLAQLPWQLQACEQLWQQHKQQRLGHAFLLCSPAHSGQLSAAVELTKSLMCSHAVSLGGYCGECDNCRLWRSGLHPDYVLLQAEADSQVIKIDQVRAMLQKMVHTKSHAAYRIAIIDRIDQLNTASANSLLKYLEEPVADTVFLLLCQNQQAVPVTILSRVQRLYASCSAYDPATIEWLSQEVNISTMQAQTLLKAADGGPELACRLAANDYFAQQQALLRHLMGAALPRADLITLAKTAFSNDAQELSLLLGIWHALLQQLVVLSCGGAGDRHVLSMLDQQLQARASKISALTWLDFMQQLQHSMQLMQGPINKPLALEQLLHHWQAIWLQAAS